MTKIKVTRYRKNNGTSALIGNFSILIPKWGNFFINGMKHFQKNGHYWISFPDREYKDEKENLKHFPFNGFTERKISDAFQEEVLNALTEFFKEEGKKSAFNI